MNFTSIDQPEPSDKDLDGKPDHNDPAEQEHTPEDEHRPERNLETLVAARRVADLVFEYASPEPGAEGIWLDDHRGEGPNPYYHQTEQGLFLEMYYGQPGKLWTPWGEYNFAGSGSGDWKSSMAEIKERLGLTLHQEEKHDDYGVHGPVYKVSKVDDVPLPDPKEREGSFFSDEEYDAANTSWGELSERLGDEAVDHTADSKAEHEK